MLSLLLSLLFGALLLLSSHLLLLLIAAQPVRRGNWIALGERVALAYGLFFATSLPLVLGGHWSVTYHLAIAAGVTFCLALAVWRRKCLVAFPLELGQTTFLFFLLSLGLGIWQQRFPIHYLYITHDPGAYLNLAKQVARTGEFEFHPAMARWAAEDPRLQTLVGLKVEAPEEWQRTQNYGAIPKNENGTRAGFHGFFGTPLLFATAIQLWGETHALKIHWLGLAAILVLLLALFHRFLPNAETAGGEGLLLLLFVSTPLVHPIFREALSEPTAALLFLGMLLFAGRPGGAPAFLLCLAGAISMRISALMYLPFALLALRSVPKTRWLLGSGVVVGLALTAAFLTSPAYLYDILSFYTQSTTKLVSGSATSLFLIGFAGSLLAAGIVYRRPLWDWIHREPNWRHLAGGALIIGGACVVARYLRLIFRLDHNIGGYPFVLFNLDSFLFYGSPLVSGLGLYYWWRRLSPRPDSHLLFLQYYLPFCLFFYGVYRFIPLNLQPNFQRYLLIELIPLAVLGTALYWRQSPHRYLFLAFGALTLAWNLVLGTAINRPDIARDSLANYQALNHYLSKKEGAVVIGVAPAWNDMAHLTPLALGMGYPLGFVHFPFSHRSAVALEALFEKDRSPLLVVNEHELQGENEIIVGNRRWTREYNWPDCYRYPQFGLGAPPLELTETCNTLVFFTAATARPLDRPSPLQPAWRDRNHRPPYPTTNWAGFTLDGSVLCREKGNVVSILLSFTPEENYRRPEVRLQGVVYPAVIKDRAAGRRGRRLAHQNEVVVPVEDLECHSGQRLDIIYGETGRRVASVQSYGVRPAIASDRRAETALR